MPNRRASVKNQDQYEALKGKGNVEGASGSIANSPGASKKGGEKSHEGGSRSSSKQGWNHGAEGGSGTKGGKATAQTLLVEGDYFVENSTQTVFPPSISLTPHWSASMSTM